MDRGEQDDYRFSENAIEWLSGERYATVTVSQKKWVDIIKKIAKTKNLGNVIVNLDGTVTARIPIEWVKIKPKGDEG